MRKMKQILTLCALVAIVATPIDANFREIHAQYFTDAQLNNLVGEQGTYCDDTDFSWGNTSAAYLGHFEVDCSTGEVSNVTCYHWNGSTYEPISCYYDEPLCCYGRLRVPIG